MTNFDCFNLTFLKIKNNISKLNLTSTVLKRFCFLFQVESSRPSQRVQRVRLVARGGEVVDVETSGNGRSPSFGRLPFIARQTGQKK